jgi:AAA15 family ATPase/GTPase
METVRVPPGTSEGVLPVAAIYGANASGKTNIILAMRFMQRAIRNSHARWEPDKPIRLDPFTGTTDTPSKFSADFLLNGVRYQYGFSMNPLAVLEEWMYAYPAGKKQTWFSREADKPIYFSTKLLGDNRAIERLTRPNSLFLSAAAQNNHEALSVIYRWFSNSLSFVTGERSATRSLAKVLHSNAGLRQRLARSLSLADLGITDLVVKDLSAKDFGEKLTSLLNKQNRSDRAFTLDEARREIQFLHRIGDSTQPFNESQESKGTIAFLCLLTPIIAALTNGGIVFVDELDESLHPLLAIEVIRQFSDVGENKRFAQLIFNTHDTNLLSSGMLRRDQIWFTEKVTDGSSQLYPLTDFKPRMQENLENGYLQGRYGAIPFLNLNTFAKAEDEGPR